MPRSASTRASKARSTERASRSRERRRRRSPIGRRRPSTSTSTRFRCAGYVQYVPLPQGLKLADGALTTRLKLAFVSEKGEPRTVDAFGHGTPRPACGHPQRRLALVGARSIDVTLGKLDPLGRTVALEQRQRRGAGCRSAARRRRRLRIPAAAGAGREAGGAATGPARGRRAVDVLGRGLQCGRRHGPRRGRRRVPRISRRAVQSQDRRKQDRIERRRGHRRGGRSIAESGAHYRRHRQPRSRKGRGARPFRADQTSPGCALSLLRGRGQPRRAAAGSSILRAISTPRGPEPRPQLTLAQGSATLADLELAVRGERDPLWRVPHGELGGIAFDLAKRTITIDRIEARPVSLRDGPAGGWRGQLPAAAARQRCPLAQRRAASAPAAAAQGGAEWSVVVQQAAVRTHGGRLRGPGAAAVGQAADPGSADRGWKTSATCAARRARSISPRASGSGGRAHAIGPMVDAVRSRSTGRSTSDGVDLLPLSSTSKRRPTSS